MHFFFFCVTKTQLGVELEGPRSTGRVKKSTAMAITILAGCLVRGDDSINFVYYQVEQLLGAAQRSDFFIFYLAFFVASTEFIVFIGLLIAVVTLIVLFFTFKNQIVTTSIIRKAKTVE